MQQIFRTCRRIFIAARQRAEENNEYMRSTTPHMLERTIWVPEVYMALIFCVTQERVAIVLCISKWFVYGRCFL